jgi:phosphomannomutase
MGLLLLEAMAMSAKGLRQLLTETMDEIGHFYYRRIDLPIGTEQKAALISRLQTDPPEIIATRPVEEKNFRDGFKFLFGDDSWLLVRPSGTEPVLRLYSEANDPKVVEQLLDAGRELAGV